MAIIYSYPTVLPTANDLVLGTDVDQAGKPTKNFTIQSIVDIVQQGATGLAAVLALGNDAGNQAAIGFTNLVGTGSVNFGSFTDGNMTITNGAGTGFTSIRSTDFIGNITGIVKAGSSIAGTVTGVTQAVGTSNTTLATTAFVANKVDPSVLQYLGDNAAGPFNLNLVSDDFKIAGTTNQIETTATTVDGNNVGTVTLKFPTAGVTLPNGSVATTQLATDDSDKVATTAFVRNYDDLQDLEFRGDDINVTGAVILNSEKLAIVGTANQIATSAGAQTLTIALTDPIVTNLTGNVTGILKATSSIQGNSGAGSTDAENVLAVTQTAGDASTRIATTKYVDDAAGVKTLAYKDISATVNTMNLVDDDLQFTGGSNITSTATAVNASNIADIKFDLNDSVGISGTMTAGTFTDGTFSGSAGTYTGGVSIESDTFTASTIPIGFIGNASTASALKNPGTIQLSSGSGASEGVASGAVTYTSGGNLSLTTSLANTTVTGKTLSGLPSFTSSAIDAADTINEALAKLQGQITASGGGGALAYEGAWRASVTAVANGQVIGSVDLVIATADANLVKGTVVEGAGITGTVRISAVTGTAVTLDTAISIADGITLTMSPPGGAITGATAGTAASLTTPANKISGRFYICDTTGKAEPNAAVPWALATTPNEWAVGDWVVYISNGSQPDEWQKLDQSNEIFGSGAANKIAKWTASNTLGTGLIEDDGTTVTIGANGNLTVLGDTILGDNAAADTITLNGPATFQSTGIFNVGIGLGGAIYGTAGQVLTSGGGSGNVNTWTTPTTGTVTTVSATTAGDALDVAVTNPTTTPAIALTWAGAASQYVNGVGNLITFPTVDNYVSWTADSDEGTDITVTSGFNLKFTGAVTSGGAGIATDSAVSANEMTIGLINSGTPSATTFYSGTGAWAVPVGTKTETLAEVLANGNNSGGAKNINMTGTISNITLVDSGTAASPVTTQGRIQFGAGADLEIYHNGSSSYIANSNTTLPLQVLSDNFRVNSYTGLENMITASVNGAVSLFYDSAQKLYTASTGIQVTGNANISGQVQVASNSLFSSNNLRFASAGDAFIDHNTTGQDINFRVSDSSNVDTTAMIIKSDGDVEFKDDVEIDGNLTVDGTINHGGVIPAGGSVSAKGGVFNFNKSIGPNLSQQQLFSILRPGTGAIAFRVTLTSGASAAVSRTKIFEVARCFGLNSPAFNQVIDSGPNTSVAANDFNVSFSTSSNGGSTTAGANSGQAVIPVSSTDFAVGIKVVQVGGGINRIPAGARIISMANQGSLGATITLDTNLTGFLSQGTTVGCVPDDIVVCKITPQNTTTQTISATVELGYDNNTTATILST